MPWTFAQVARLRRTPAERALVCVLVLHIFALFSFMPFGQPVIAVPAAAASVGTVTHAMPGPAGEVSRVEGLGATVIDADSVQAIKPDGNSQRVFGTRSQADADLFELGAARLSIFEGLRACASLPAHRARQVYLAPARPYLLRAPPTGA